MIGVPRGAIWNSGRRGGRRAAVKKWAPRQKNKGPAQKKGRPNKKKRRSADYALGSLFRLARPSSIKLWSRCGLRIK